MGLFHAFEVGFSLHNWDFPNFSQLAILIEGDSPPPSGHYAPACHSDLMSGIVFIIK